MRSLRISACVTGVSLFIFLPALFAQQSCRVTLQANVEVAEAEFSLADLLTGDTCPVWLRASERVRLGRAPLAGSARVFEGNEVRTLLERIAASNEVRLLESTNASVPERITVRRAGTRASCVELGRRILASLPAIPRSGESGLPKPETTGLVAAREIDCSAANWLPRETALELTRKVWNPALGSWEVSARCVDPKDCVPFLLRVPGRDLPRETAQPVRSAEDRPAKSTVGFADSAIAVQVLRSRKALVRPGQSVSLLWEQDGIRLVVRAISLDAGGAGEEVRARIEHGGRTLRAVVVAAGALRATS